MIAQNKRADGAANTDGSNKINSTFSDDTLTDQHCPQHFPASVLGGTGFLIPLEVAYKTTLLTRDEAKLFYFIAAELLCDLGTPCREYMDTIEEHTGLNEKRQREARTSLMMQDFIRCEFSYDYLRGQEKHIYSIPGVETWK